MGPGSYGEIILAALRTFDWDDYGLDDVGRPMNDEGLDIGLDLAAHIEAAIDERHRGR